MTGCVFLRWVRVNQGSVHLEPVDLLKDRLLIVASQQDGIGRHDGRQPGRTQHPPADHIGEPMGAQVGARPTDEQGG